MNVSEVVPFVAVEDIAKSVTFYVDGLGFVMKHQWVDDGVLRSFCHLEFRHARSSPKPPRTVTQAPQGVLHLVHSSYKYSTTWQA